MLMQFSELEIIKHGDADPTYVLVDKNDRNEKWDRNSYIHIYIYIYIYKYIYIYTRVKLHKTTGIIAGDGEYGEGSSGELEFAGLGVDWDGGIENISGMNLRKEAKWARKWGDQPENLVCGEQALTENGQTKGWEAGKTLLDSREQQEPLKALGREKAQRRISGQFVAYLAGEKMWSPRDS